MQKDIFKNRKEIIMSRYIKPIIIGIVIGTALYFVPIFVLKTVFILALVTLVARMLFNPRRHFERKLAFIDKIRGMSEEEYIAMKERRSTGGWYCMDHKSTQQTQSGNQKENK